MADRPFVYGFQKFSKLTAIALFIALALLLAAGCVSQPRDNLTNIISINGSTFVPVTPAELTICPRQANTTPWIEIDRISYHNIGDVFEITGTTNLGIERNLSYQIIREPLRSRIPSTVFELHGPVRIQGQACDKNRWSFSINTSGLGGGYYDILVGTENMTISDWELLYLEKKIPKREVIS